MLTSEVNNSNLWRTQRVYADLDHKRAYYGVFGTVWNKHSKIGPNDVYEIIIIGPNQW